MTKRDRKTTSSTIERRLKQKRGEGHGLDYKPWLNTQDVPSTGQLNRITSHTVGRRHELMSELEAKYLLVFDWIPQIVDIREQFPLLHLDDTRRIAEGLKIDHPKDPATKEYIVMTTDFVISIDGPEGRIDRAIAVKPATQLQNRRVIEKLQIEQVYWSAANVHWCIATEKDIDPVFVGNVKLLRDYLVLDNNRLTTDDIEDIAAELVTRLQQPTALSKAALDIDRSLGLDRGTSLAVAYHLMATRRWKVNMHVAINASKPIQFDTPL